MYISNEVIIPRCRFSARAFRDAHKQAWIMK